MAKVVIGVAVAEMPALYALYTGAAMLVVPETAGREVVYTPAADMSKNVNNKYEEVLIALNQNGKEYVHICLSTLTVDAMICHVPFHLAVGTLLIFWVSRSQKHNMEIGCLESSTKTRVWRFRSRSSPLF